MRPLASLVLLAVLPGGSAQELSSIRVSVRLVNVGFTVRDSGGKLVTDLTKDDFEVLDDGQAQPISFFARGKDLPLTLGLIVDVSGSQEQFVKQHQRDLDIFLKNALSPRDRVFVVRFGNHLRLATDLSPSGPDLLDRMKEPDRKKHEEAPEIGPPEYRSGGTAFYDAIYYATRLKFPQEERGRRALIVFSDGEDNSSSRNMMETIEAAQAENVVLFGIRYTETRKGEWTARNKYGASVMSRMSRETGGADFDAHAADLGTSFREIGEQLRSSYELAYHANPVADGTFHKIVIRARQPGLTIRTKTGYFSKEETGAQ